MHRKRGNQNAGNFHAYLIRRFRNQNRCSEIAIGNVKLQSHVHNVATSDLASDQTEPKTFSNEIG